MDLIPKWRPIYYYFVCMFISPLSLIFTSKFFCFLYMMTRQRGLINMQTKESVIGRHFGIRSITNPKSFQLVIYKLFLFYCPAWVKCASKHYLFSLFFLRKKSDYRQSLEGKSRYVFDLIGDKIIATDRKSLI